MFTSYNESLFILDSIKKHHKVLEYGSGESTKELAVRCDHVVSIEHQKEWYEIVSISKPVNCHLIYAPPSLPYVEGGHCGSYEQFKDYIEAPLPYAPFDIIFIDGRARVGCSSICNKLGHPDTMVFIHDYTRSEYEQVKDYLKLIDSCEQMAKYVLL